MNDDLCYTFNNGKMITIPPIDELCTSLKEKFWRQERVNECLKEENRKLKEGIWEKELIDKLKATCEKYKKSTSFIISEEERKNIDKWIKSRENIYTGAIGGRYEYRFFPTSIGIAGIVVDSLTGEEFKFREIS